MSDPVILAAIAGVVTVVGTLGTFATSLVTLLQVRATKRDVKEIRGAMAPALQNRQRGTPPPGGYESPRSADARTRREDRGD